MTFPDTVDRGIYLLMADRRAQATEATPEQFVCRPRSLRNFLRLRHQGAFPPFRWMKPLWPTIEITSPLMETIILACLPTILLIFLFEMIPGLKAPHQPAWVRPVCFASLVISSPLSVWWYWFSPRNDFVTISAGYLRWRVSLSRWEWFRSRGSLALDALTAFSYRSDGLVSEPVDCGRTTAEKLARLVLEVNLSRHDLAIHDKNGKTVVIEKLLARFEPEDLRTLFDQLCSSAERQEIQL